MSYETISWETPQKGVGILSLNRPRLFNSVNYRMMEELESFWRDRREDLDTAVIILRGNGNKGFCAGLQMREARRLISEMNLSRFYRFQARLARIPLAMRQAPQPIICAVHGPAVGLGFSFALASDIRVITTDARFSAAFINLGLGGADMACSYFLPRAIGAGRAYEFMYTGEFIPAETAMDLGLVSKIVVPDALMDATMSCARTLIGKNHLGLRLTKEAVNVNLDAAGLEQALQLEDRNQSLLAMGHLFAKGHGKK